MSSNHQNNSDKSWLNLQFHDDDQQRIKKPDELEIDKKDYPSSIVDNQLLDRIQGSIFGMAIGDALGAHVEFRPHSYLETNPVKELHGGGTWGLDKGQFTDDTSMALCLTNSLIVCHDFVPYDQLVRYKWWYRNGYMSSTGHCFDIGAATRQAIQEFERRQKLFAQEHGISSDQMDSFYNSDLLQQFNVYCSKEGVAGNGALMRLAPVPLFFYRDTVKAVEYSGISGKITHGDKKAYDACRYYGALIVATLRGATREDLISNQFYENHKLWFGDETLHPDIMSIAQGSYKRKGGYNDGIRGKGYVVNALEAALWAFWSDENSFENGVLNAVNLGDDTDTTAAIYGQLAGAFYGYNKLPDKWREAIYAKNFVSCVSNWIVYEGERWFKNQTATDMKKSLINSDPTNINQTRNKTIVTNPEPYLSTNRGFSITTSIGYNPMDIIERKAVDPAGRIGSFYDVHKDRLVESSSSNVKSNNNPAHPLIKCKIERGEKIECQNLLQFFGFDNELRMSLVSEMIVPTGIASVIEYPYLIDECTRTLYYSYTIRQEYLPIDANSIRKSIEQSTVKGVGTHIITGIDIGIDLILILRITSNQSKIIDDTLNKIQQSLINHTKLLDNISLDGILSTHIYSNIDHLNKQKTLTDVYRTICQIKMNSDDYRPSNYILHPIETFLPNNNQHCLTFIPLKATIVQKVEQYLFQFSWINKMWLTILDNEQSINVLKKYLKEQLNEIQNRVNQLNEQSRNEKKRLKELILKIRYGKDSDKTIEHQILNEDIETTSKDTIDDLIYSLTSLKEKGYFIDDLNGRGFDYHKANQYNIQQNDHENLIEQKLIKNNPYQRFVCSNDILNINHFSILEQFCSILSNENKCNPQLNIIYVDFSYSSYELDQIKVYPLINSLKDIYQHPSLLNMTTDISNHPSLLSIDDKTINILLLGKSGVGKSTLINTFINYLKFNSYEQILSSQSPLPVLISFVHLIKVALEEDHLIQFGLIDRNEDWNHPDQSTTQHCKSYNFILKNGEKICLIDTPGFNKIVNQTNDDITMQHILSRIINLTHLNSICILIEPDEKQFDCYQTCLTKLFYFLGDNSSKNVVFCFTKVLSQTLSDDQKNNFIKLMIKSFSTKNIHFNDKAIFHFDSYYFLDSTISHRFKSLNHLSHRTSQQSWTTNKNGWNHLLDYIHQNLHPYSIQQGLQKAQSARLQINQIIRPLLETIRNHFRNFILSKSGYSNDSIEFYPTSLLYPSAICYSCQRNSSQCGLFWIMSDSPHEYRNTCYKCSCHSQQHIQIDYRLKYKYLQNQTNYHYQQTFISREDLLYITVHLSYFLLQRNQKTSYDRLLFHLNKIIDEERSICENLSSPRMNLALYNQLSNFKHNYQKEIDIIKQNHLPDHFDIDDLIEKVKQIPLIKIQLDAANKIQEVYV